MPDPLFPDITQFIISIVVSLLVIRHYSNATSLRCDKYHTFWPRFLAPHVDDVVLWIPFSLIPYFIADHYTFSPEEIQNTVLVTTILYFVYSIILHAKYGGTLGKLSAKIRVVQAKGEAPISWKHAILRDAIPLALIIALGLTMSYEPADPIIVAGEYYTTIEEPNPALYYMSMVLIGWFLLEIITMLTNSKRRALHDFIAGTVVVRINIKEPTLGMQFTDGRNIHAGPVVKIQKPTS